MNTLWITGDSFSVTIPDDQHIIPWTMQLANQLNYNLKNNSEWGVCQDWSWDFINREKLNISSNDQLIVVLTDPARFWYFEEIPSLTNSHVLDFSGLVENKNRTQAASNYIQYIQRPSLDTQMMAHRLGWLNNLATLKSWKKPIILVAFDMYLPDLSDFNNLVFSDGCLRSIDQREHTEDFKLKTIDVRYNHLCLRNHSVLANKLYNTIINNENLDLHTGFHTHILSNNSMEDPKFIETDLSPWLVKKSKSIKLHQ